MRRFLLLFALVITAAALSVASAFAHVHGITAASDDGVFRVRNLVSDGFVPAERVDPNLVNAWGLVAGPTTPWWVADNGTDVATLYGGDGTPVPLVVQVEGGPTGTVFNGGTGFVVVDGAASGAARFIFASEDGKIRGWNPAVPPPPPAKQAIVAADRSHEGAIYKGLALASTPHGDFLYAADFHNARIDVFDAQFNLVGLPGGFVDPRLPHGYAPFGIRNLDGKIVVTYAKQDADAEDEVAGVGRGFVSAFATDGTFLGRIASRGNLNAPWGLAIAPHGFGNLEGDLLVGNFGDGRINAYRPAADGQFVHEGELLGEDHHPIAIDGLWGISFGNGAAAGPTDTLFFAAGPDDEQHGLFGAITAG